MPQSRPSSVKNSHSDSSAKSQKFPRSENERPVHDFAGQHQREEEEPALYPHHDRGHRRREGFGPGSYGFEGDSTRRIGATVEDDYSDHYGYGSSFGSGSAHHNQGWVDDGNRDDSPGKSFMIPETRDEAESGRPAPKVSSVFLHDEVCR
ncbi:MAG: hypothetical protein EOP09_15535, partial [Proteobacteria bacterium]